MIKHIFSLMIALLACAPLSLHAEASVEVIEQGVQEIGITLSQSNLHVTGANGETLYIYKVTGVCVMSFKVEGNDKRYELNLPKGCYIVKVGDVVRKVSIR